MTQLFDTSPQTDAVAYAHVALEQGIDAGPGGLTYAVPAKLADLRVGERVVVPLGRGDKPVSGFVIELSERCDLPPSKLAKLKRVSSRDRQGVALTPDLIALAQWMAGYYCCPLGMVLQTMLPAAVKRGTGIVMRRMVRVAPGSDEAAPDAPEPFSRDPKGSAPGDEGARDGTGDAKEPEPKLTKLQKRIVAEARRLAAEGEPWIEVKELADAAGAKTTSPVKQLIDKGVLEVASQSGVRASEVTIGEDDDNAAPLGGQTLVLTPAQDRVLKHLAGHVHGGFGVHLLHGVTGSGKTEVYLRVIEQVLAKCDEATKRQSDEEDSGAGAPAAIVLVPEIALTPQTVARFFNRFAHVGVAVLHSGLTAAQRHEQWQRIRRGDARIVVGARSAVFAPIVFRGRGGVIIVDEEHESSYKQDQLPRYHARDVAIKRAQLLGIPVLLGSATPSLESYANAAGASRRPSYHLLELPDRVAGFKLPAVQIVDMVAERRRRYEYSGKAGVHLLSLALESHLRRVLKAGGQAMLLLNRRGFANYIACPDHNCGWLMHCDYCDATVVYHKDRSLPAGGVVRCHHCTAEQLLPPECPKCQKKVTTFGLGTQRVEEELDKKFEGVTHLRMDSDSMRTGHDYHAALSRFRRGEVHVLVGTQMIAKGLDFPNVRLVGVISADTALHLPDFRAGERTFQLIAQVAGRAGRGQDSGLVVVQTFSPEDPAIVLASKHDYATFAHRELGIRRSMGLPPATRMARIVCRDRDPIACIEQAKKLANALRQFNEQLDTQVRMRGPMPCPIGRIAEYYRQQIELIAADAGRLQKLMTALRNAKLLKSDAHTAVDVDPVVML